MLIERSISLVIGKGLYQTLCHRIYNSVKEKEEKRERTKEREKNTQR